MGTPATEMLSFMAKVFPTSLPLGAPTTLQRQYLQLQEIKLAILSGKNFFHSRAMTIVANNSPMIKFFQSLLLLQCI